MLSVGRTLPPVAAAAAAAALRCAGCRPALVSRVAIPAAACRAVAVLATPALRAAALSTATQSGAAATTTVAPAAATPATSDASANVATWVELQSAWAGSNPSSSAARVNKAAAEAAPRFPDGILAAMAGGLRPRGAVEEAAAHAAARAVATAPASEAAAVDAAAYVTSLLGQAEAAAGAALVRWGGASAPQSGDALQVAIAALDAASRRVVDVGDIPASVDASLAARAYALTAAAQAERGDARGALVALRRLLAWRRAGGSARADDVAMVWEVAAFDAAARGAAAAGDSHRAAVVLDALAEWAAAAGSVPAAASHAVATVAATALGGFARYADTTAFTLASHPSGSNAAALRSALTVPAGEVVLPGGVRLTEVMRRHAAAAANAAQRQRTAAAAATPRLAPAGDAAGDAAEAAEGEAADVEVTDDVAVIEAAAVDSIVAAHAAAAAVAPSPLVHDAALALAVRSGSAIAVARVVRAVAASKGSFTPSTAAVLQAARRRAEDVGAARARLGGSGQLDSRKLMGVAPPPPPHSREASSREADAATAAPDVMPAVLLSPYQLAPPPISGQAAVLQPPPVLAFDDAQWRTLLEGVAALTAAPPPPPAVARALLGAGAAAGEVVDVLHRTTVPLVSLAADAGRLTTAANHLDALADACAELQRTAGTAAPTELLPRAAAYGAFIRGAVRAGQPARALRVAEHATALGHTLPPSARAACVDALLTLGDVAAAERSLEPPAAGGAPLPPSAYLAVMGAHGAARNAAGVMRALRAAQAAGHLRAVDAAAHRGIFNVCGLPAGALSTVLFDGLRALRAAVAAGRLPPPTTLRVYHTAHDRAACRSVLQSQVPPLDARSWGLRREARHLLVPSEVLMGWFTDVGASEGGTATSSTPRRGTAFGAAGGWAAGAGGGGGDTASSADDAGKAADARAAYYAGTLVPPRAAAASTPSSSSSPAAAAAASGPATDASTAPLSAAGAAAATALDAWHKNWAAPRARARARAGAAAAAARRAPSQPSASPPR